MEEWRFPAIRKGRCFPLEDSGLAVFMAPRLDSSK